MGILTLLESARLAGLTLVADGDRLRITGPSSAADVVKELAAHKAELLEHLAARRVLPVQRREIPVSILATIKRDPFASVVLPSPTAPPPPAVPSYRIPASGQPAPPLKVTPLTAKEMALDGYAVAAACYAAVRSSPGFKEWPFWP